MICSVLSLLKVVKVSNATVHARSNVPGSAKYELVIEVQQVNYEITGEFNVVHNYFSISFQDMLLAFGFKTYFVRSSSAKETAIKGAKITTLSPTKTFPKHIAEDIPIENDVILCHAE